MYFSRCLYIYSVCYFKERCIFLKLWDLFLESCGCYFCRISHRRHVADFKLLWRTVQHGSRCRCKAMAVRRLRGAPHKLGFQNSCRTYYRRLYSVVGTITRLQGLDDPRSAIRRVWKIFLFLKTSRPALGPTQPPSQRVPGVFSPGIKRLGLAADHSSPSSAEVKRVSVAIPPLSLSAFMQSTGTALPLTYFFI